MKQLAYLVALTGAALLATESMSSAIAQEGSVAARDTVPQWVWLSPTSDHPEVVFRRAFEVSGEGLANYGRRGGATLAGSCDNHMTVSVNGKKVATHGSWEQVITRDVSSALVAGRNMIEVRARNEGLVAGLALRLSLGEDSVIVTDASWQCASPRDATADKWSNATVIGPVGGDGLAWSGQVTLASYGPAGARVAPAQVARPAEGITLPEGFEAELVYTVPRDQQGSWVALTNDPQGRIYTSDQGGKGIYRVTPAKIGDASSVTTVERVDVEVSGAQGMYWAFDSLYVNVNGQGMWRITDTDGDDHLDKAENLIPLGYGGEHGPHAILPTVDGKGLYFIAGNHTKAPEFDGSRAPSNWSEDLLLPRQWDARGHARGILAPGGWIARCDPDGKNIEILSTGYRNQYDIALNAHGEMFTYDADMEWDIGMPWYRPTRICHVTSGSEFGWRSGTGKWPTYYEDSLPPAVEIGPGSPTGIVFGTGAKFPAKFQEALFILDWTFGTIYAVHLEPMGASYTATKEDFLWAKPLAVTDAIVGADGALYFAVGGRGSQSALYRVIYTGTESTVPVDGTLADKGSRARQQRRSLEAYHGHVDPNALDSAWPLLSSEDRFIRFAARIAVENQPVDTWRAAALRESDTQTTVMALLALARQGNGEDLPALVTALGRLDLKALPLQQRLAALRVYAVAFARWGQPDDALRDEMIARLDPLFPASNSDVNTELARLLTYLQSPEVVAKTLTLMAATPPTELPPWAELIQRNDQYGGPIAKMLANMPPLQNTNYAFILRNATAGWTMEQRKAYFAFFVEAAKHPGGASYSGFLENMREEAAANLTVGERRTLAAVLGESLVAPELENVTPPVGPGRKWTLEEAVSVTSAPLVGRDFDTGRNLFHAASCSACHRFDGEGGAIGPDLTTVANKFSVADLMESIVEPSKVISDQYGSSLVVDHDGMIADGIVVEDGDEISVYLRDHKTPPMVFDRSEIALIKESPLSQMPDGLVDALSPDELTHLVAYLLSGGNKKADFFKKAKGAGGKD